MTTKASFIQAYRHHFTMLHPDETPGTIENIMYRLARSLYLPSRTTRDAEWYPNGESARQAWRSIGQTGMPTIQSLRALP